MLVRCVLDSLTLPDVLALLVGDWHGLQSLHAPLHKQLTALLPHNPSVSHVQALVTGELLKDLKTSLHDQLLPQARTQETPGTAYLRVGSSCACEAWLQPS